MRTSYSEIACYKNCRRMWELKYKHRLYPAVKPETLATGSSYHKKVADILNPNGSGILLYDDDLKTNAMAEAFNWYIDIVFDKQSILMSDVEVEKEMMIGNHKVRGFVDAITIDGIPVEHKTTSRKINGEYWYSLENNEQVLMYMLLTGKNQIIYTAIQKPTIRLRQNETESEYQHRLFEWYDTDTDQKIGWQLIVKDQAEIDWYRTELESVISEMNACRWHYKNPSICYLYNRACEYMPICHTYKDGDMTPTGFTKGEKKNEDSQF